MFLLLIGAGLATTAWFIGDALAVAFFDIRLHLFTKWRKKLEEMGDVEREKIRSTAPIIVRFENSKVESFYEDSSGKEVTILFNNYRRFRIEPWPGVKLGDSVVVEVREK